MSNNISPVLPLDPEHVTSYVQSLGHSDLQAYQSWYGLKDDGIIGSITSSLLAEHRCGVPDFVDGPEEAQWPKSCMKVPVAYDFDSIPADIAAESWRLALKMWNDACGITLHLVEVLADGKVWATDGPLPGSTLAWSFLANDRCDTRLEQRYDTTVSYTVDFLAKIIGHEVGHALGLQHSNNRKDLLFASIGNAPFSSYPGPGDLRAVILRYGPPVDEPDEPNDPDQPDDPDQPSEVLFRFTSKKAGQKFILISDDKSSNGWKI